MCTPEPPHGSVDCHVSHADLRVVRAGFTFVYVGAPARTTDQQYKSRPARGRQRRVQNGTSGAQRTMYISSSESSTSANASLFRGAASSSWILNSSPTFPCLARGPSSPLTTSGPSSSTVKSASPAKSEPPGKSGDDDSPASRIEVRRSGKAHFRIPGVHFQPPRAPWPKWDCCNVALTRSPDGMRRGGGRLAMPQHGQHAAAAPAQPTSLLCMPVTRSSPGATNPAPNGCLATAAHHPQVGRVRDGETHTPACSSRSKKQLRRARLATHTGHDRLGPFRQGCPAQPGIRRRKGPATLCAGIGVPCACDHKLHVCPSHGACLSYFGATTKTRQG